MEQAWTYLINQFLTSTAASYRKMKQIADYTLSALIAAAATADDAGKAFFNQLITTLTPFVNTYDDAYIAWQSKQGVQKGQTKGLNNLLEDLRGTFIQDWDLAIQNVYRQGTPGYIKLLGRRRAPFQTGSQQDRISAVGALELLLKDEPKLQTLFDQVEGFYNELVAANSEQKGSKSTKSGSSEEVETDRVSVAIALYGVLGMLMNWY